MSRYASLLRVALVDLRGSVRRFTILLLCLTLAVATIGTIATLRYSVEAALADNARAILGGDLEVLSRRADIDADVRSALEGLGKVSRVVEMNTQARVGDHVAFLSVQAVDVDYPLVGSVVIEEGPSGVTPAQLLAPRDGVFGLLLSRQSALQLGIAPGAKVRIGRIDMELRGIIGALPDAAARSFQLGAPALLPAAALEPAGLRETGVLSHFRYKLALRAGTADNARQTLESQFPTRDWNVRTPSDATANIARFIEIFGNFMLLVALTSLVVGGIGIANSVSAYLAARQDAIATLRALGATGGRVTLHFVMQILVFSQIGIGLGLAALTALTTLATPLLSSATGLELRLLVSPTIMGLTAGLALTMAFTASWLPLKRAEQTSPSHLFRAVGAGAVTQVPLRTLLRPALALPLLCGLLAGALFTLALVNDFRLVAGYALGVVATLLVLRLAASLLMLVLAHVPAATPRILRFAASAITRPGAPTTTIVVSLGMGLVLLLLIATSEANIEAQLATQLDGNVPDFVLLDMSKSDKSDVLAFVARTPDIVDTSSVPMLRGVISAIKGQAAPKSDQVDQSVADMFRGDTALTWAAVAPADTDIVAGDWWSPDYAGPPLMSVSTEMRDALGLALGDAIELTIAGRPISFTIASFRRVEWRSPAFNFRMIVSPGLIEAAPQSYFMTVRAKTGAQRKVEAGLLATFPSLAFVPVGDAIAKALTFLSSISTTLSIVGSTAIGSGLLVLASVLGVTRRQREAEAVVMKILGAPRAMVVGAFLIEYALTGAMAVFIAMTISVAGAWALSVGLLGIPFSAQPQLVITVSLLVIMLTAGAGAGVTWTALSRSPARHLRDSNPL